VGRAFRFDLSFALRQLTKLLRRDSQRGPLGGTRSAPNASHCLCRVASADSIHLLHSFRRSACPLGAGSELVVLVFEQDVERGERCVTARDILLQVELVRFAQFVARVHLLLENLQIIPNHDDRFGESKHAQPASSGYFKNLDLLGDAPE
jgi:hypothetical protein